MKRGYHPIAYYSNPNVSKPLDDIFTDINEFTDEVFPHETERFGNLAVFILLPPLLYDGHFVKGILFTQGAELLIERFPWIQEVFHIYAYSMWSSFPQSTRADGLFMSYPNPARVEWFRTKYPERAHQVLVPLCDSDFFNEYSLVPKLSVKKDIDILCVARLDLVKNLPMFAQALKVLRQKYPATPMRATLLTGANFDINWNGLEEREKAELRKINQALGSTPDYLEVVPTNSKTHDYLLRSKTLVLSSLIEGKNRAIHEAMSTDVPVVTFAAFNQYTRGGHPTYSPQAGLQASEFTPESLADTLFAAVKYHDRFSPRRAVLGVSGRRHVLNTCIEALPYYASQLPDYQPGHHMYNRWLDLAMQQFYEAPLHTHLYQGSKAGLFLRGLQPVESGLKRYENLIPLSRRWRKMPKPADVAGTPAADPAPVTVPLPAVPVPQPLIAATT